jgi:hemerythrin superfamily protein
LEKRPHLVRISFTPQRSGAFTDDERYWVACEILAPGAASQYSHQRATMVPRSRSACSKENKMAADKSTDAVAMLKEDHRKVEALFESFEIAKGSDKKKTLAEQICTELTIHATIEEGIFYPACREKIEDQDLLDEAYVEHDGAKVLITEILAASPEDEFYDAKVKVLSEMIKHHVKEEEKRSEGLFAQAKEAGLDMEALGAQMAAEKEKLKASFKSGGLPKQAPSTFHAITLN